jgi:hypothetical protein
MRGLRISSFRADVTPPLGSPLCGGWIAPASKIADPLYAIGLVLLSDEAPVVLCAVDWCEICNEAQARLLSDLADAVGTSTDRIALHTVHQHNAPIMDLGAQRLISTAPGLADLMDRAHFLKSCAQIAEAARVACRGSTRAITHLGLGGARVREVASARRILGPHGTVRATRWSACKDRALRAEPEGVIDPILRTVAFLENGVAVAMLHYYATHPISYYGDGVVTADFVGIARRRLRSATPGCEHLCFTGCGGDISTGKYNDGSP